MTSSDDNFTQSALVFLPRGLFLIFGQGMGMISPGSEYGGARPEQGRTPVVCGLFTSFAHRLQFTIPIPGVLSLEYVADHVRIVSASLMQGVFFSSAHDMQGGRHIHC